VSTGVYLDSIFLETQYQMETRIHTTAKRRHLHSHHASVEQKLSSQTKNTTRLLQNNQRWLPKINHTTL